MVTKTNGATKKKAVPKRTAKRKPKPHTNRIEPVAKIVEIQPLNTAKITFDLIGTSPLVCHNFDKKAIRQMLDNQTGKSTRATKEPRCPVEEFLQAFYWLEGAPPAPDDVKDGIKSYKEATVRKAIKNGAFGMRITGFKNAMIATGRNTGMKMSAMRQMMFVTGDHPDYAVIHGTPEMHESIVRISNKTPMVRFRPMWVEWSTRIHVEFDRNQLSPDQIANIVNVAGYYVGIGEGRPEKSALGWGRWKIAS